MYPAHFYLTYPLAFIGGLAGMYALRSEIVFSVGFLVGVAVIGGVWFAAGWSSTRPARANGRDDADRFGLLAGILSVPAYFLGKELIGGRGVLWFCSLAFALMAAGSVVGAVVHRPGAPPMAWPRRPSSEGSRISAAHSSRHESADPRN